MIEGFKILNNFDKINPDILFEMKNVTVKRGKEMKLLVRRYNIINHNSMLELLNTGTGSQPQKLEKKDSFKF